MCENHFENAGLIWVRAGGTRERHPSGARSDGNDMHSTGSRGLGAGRLRSSRVASPDAGRRSGQAILLLQHELISASMTIICSPFDQAPRPLSSCPRCIEPLGARARRGLAPRATARGRFGTSPCSRRTFSCPLPRSARMRGAGLRLPSARAAEGHSAAVHRSRRCVPAEAHAQRAPSGASIATRPHARRGVDRVLCQTPKIAA